MGEALISRRGGGGNDAGRKMIREIAGTSSLQLTFPSDILASAEYQQTYSIECELETATWRHIMTADVVVRNGYIWATTAYASLRTIRLNDDNYSPSTGSVQFRTNINSSTLVNTASFTTASGGWFLSEPASGAKYVKFRIYETEI